MTRALLALLLAGCLQGGEEPLEGHWGTLPTDLCHCFIDVQFGPLGQSTAGTFSIRINTPTLWEQVGGWYTVIDEHSLLIETEQGYYNIRYGMGDVPNRLLLGWGGSTLSYLFRLRDTEVSVREKL